MNIIIDLVLFILPAYFANAVPVLLGGGTPLDLRKRFFDGERIFGDGKTIRGFIAGIAVGTVIGGVIAIFIPLWFFENKKMQFLASVGLALGTMIGDAFGSFAKRRMRLKPGTSFLPDSVIFLIVALLFAYPFTKSNLYTTTNILFLLVLTIILHPLTNFIANRIGLKKVPW